MNHPTPEDWITYLYDEAPASERPSLERHLRECPDCRRHVEGQRNAMGLLDLDTATLAVPSRDAGLFRTWRPRLAWAAAASVMLCAGFLAGRAGRVSRQELRQELETVRTELRDRYNEDLKTLAAATVSATTQQNRQALRELRDEFVEARAQDQRQLLTVLDRMEVQRVQDYRNLSGGLVRLARETGNGFRQAEDQFNTLASTFTPTEPNPTSKENQP